MSDTKSTPDHPHGLPNDPASNRWETEGGAVSNAELPKKEVPVLPAGSEVVAP